MKLASLIISHVGIVGNTLMSIYGYQQGNLSMLFAILLTAVTTVFIIGYLSCVLTIIGNK